MHKGFFHDIPLWNNNRTHINAFIEIPKWCFVKYEFNKELNVLEVDRILSAPSTSYPFNYGFLPQTWNEEDNDPLDVIVLSLYSFFPQCIVPCKLIWGIKVIDNGESDYKIIWVAPDKYYTWVEDVTDLSEIEKQDIVYFLEHYKDLEGKKVEVIDWDSRGEAIAHLEKAFETYKKRYGS